MVEPELRYPPHILEEEARTLWRARRLPPPGGVLGRADAPVVHQFLGSFSGTDQPTRAAQRAITADVDARYFSMSGRRAVGTLRLVSSPADSSAAPLGPLLTALGVWVGGEGDHPWDQADRTATVATIVGRLAHAGVLVVRDFPFRVCPACSVPRTPEGIIYQEEEGATHLVRFAVSWGERRVSALAWVDAPWRLLGMSALLVNPDLPYVIARFQRREVDELVLTSASSLERLRSWLTDARMEVLEEVTGRSLVGKPYEYPLRHEFPMGGTLTPPAGTIQAVPDVGDSGTGIVPLVPGHGGTDGQIAERLHVSGWPLLTPRGQLDLTLMHKYAGLDLDTANDFVVRDLSDGGGLFAELRVRRGVPRCVVCGTALVWAPGRAWCLEPSHLSRAATEAYRRLLPNDPSFTQMEVVAWPVSESSTSSSPSAVPLLECSRCERLEAPEADLACPCGGRKRVAARRLLPAFAGAIAAWARTDPFPLGHLARVYLNDRRRGPALVHQLAAASVVDGVSGDFAITLVPTVGGCDLATALTSFGADAVRSAVIRAEGTDVSANACASWCAHEYARLSRLWTFARRLSGELDASTLVEFSRPIREFLSQLEPEDRALLARWERVRAQALADYARGRPSAVLRRFHHFMEGDLADYREWTADRMRLPGKPPTKRAVLRTFVYVLVTGASLMAPVTPFVSESLHRMLTNERVSVFEGSVGEIDRALADDALVTAWDRWRSVLHALATYRGYLRLPPVAVLPSVALVVATDDVGDQLRKDTATIARIARVDHLDVGSPRAPWTGLQLNLQPNEEEIQRAYPSQATQIVHLLQRMPARTGGKPPKAEDLSVVIAGLPRSITPAMYEYVPTLPPGMVTVPWSAGEMYVARPADAAASTALPPLSSDALWLVRRIDKRLRRSAPAAPGTPRVAIVAAVDPLASEVRLRAEVIAKCLELDELRVIEKSAERPPKDRITGRTRSGTPWWVDLPGLPPEVRPPLPSKPLVPKSRVSAHVTAPSLVPGEVDFADPAVVEHGQSVRSLGEQLDAVLEAPLLGPSKVERAWEVGLTSVEEFRNAPFEKVASLPGFGPALTGELFVRLGRPVPEGAARPPRARDGLRALVQDRPGLPPEASSPRLAVTLPSPSVASSPTVAEPVAPAMPGPAEARPPPSVTPEPSLPPVVEEAQLAAGPDQEAAEAEDVPAPVPEVPEASLNPPIPVEAEPPPQTQPTPPAEPGGEPELESPPSTGSEEVPSQGTAEELPIPAAEEPAPLTEEGAAPAPEAPIPEPETEGEVPQPEVETPSEPELGTEVENTTPPEVGESVEAPPAAPEVPGTSGIEPEEPGTEAATTAEPETPVTEVVVPKEPEPAAPAPAPVEPIEPEIAPQPEVEPPPPVGEASPSKPVAQLTPPPSPEVRAPPLGAVPPAGVPSPPPPPSEIPKVGIGVELEPGGSLLTSLQPFLDASAAGHRGVAVVRESPERIRAHAGGRPIEVYWLTNFGRGPTVRPGDLDGLGAFLRKSLEEEHVTVFFLEGLEYLIRLHGVGRVLGLLTEFDARLREKDARAWVHLTPDLLSPSDFDQIRAAFGGPSS